MSVRRPSLARAALASALVVALYFALRAALTAVTEDDGLLTPGGSPRVAVVALGAAVLVLRLVVIAIVPAAFAHASARAMFDRATGDDGR